MAPKMKFVKEILPPFVFKALQRSRFRRYGWFGNYPSWEAALARTTGYDNDAILQKILEATRKVKDGQAVYEQDSVIFDKIRYDWPVLAGVLWVAAQHSGRLSVIDFGGSLGRTFFQNRRFLMKLSAITWSIVEQPAFVRAGQKYFQDEKLKFYFDVASCNQAENANVILLSSVLSYMQQPYELLEFLHSQAVEFLIIDRLPLIDGNKDRLTVQYVSPEIYEASYPAWFFSESKFTHFIRSRFDLVEEYDCDFSFTIPCRVKGFILKRKEVREGFS